MQIKSKIIIILVSILFMCTIISRIHADEFNISALDISVDKEYNIDYILSSEKNGAIISQNCNCKPYLKIDKNYLFLLFFD